MTNVAMSGDGSSIAFLVRDLEDTFVQVYQNNLNLSNDQKILRGQRIIISTIGNRILDASVAINNDGSRIIVGKYPRKYNNSGVKTSAVDVYEYTYFTTHSEWVAICSHTNATDSFFAYSVAMSLSGDEYMMAGTFVDASGNTSQGEVYEITTDASGAYVCIRLGDIINEGDDAGDFFTGYSVAMAELGGEQTVAIASPLLSGVLETGQVQVYNLDASLSWVRVGDPIAGSTTGVDASGNLFSSYSIDMGGTIAHDAHLIIAEMCATDSLVNLYHLDASLVWVPHLLTSSVVPVKHYGVTMNQDGTLFAVADGTNVQAYIEDLSTKVVNDYGAAIPSGVGDSVSMDSTGNTLCVGVDVGTISLPSIGEDLVLVLRSIRYGSATSTWNTIIQSAPLTLSIPAKAIITEILIAIGLEDLGFPNGSCSYITDEYFFVYIHFNMTWTRTLGATQKAALKTALESGFPTIGGIPSVFEVIDGTVSGNSYAATSRICFAAGTMITTDRGEVAIEDLSIRYR